MRTMAASVIFAALIVAGCGKSKPAQRTTTSGTLTATAPPPVAAPRVVVEKSGFGQHGTQMGYGVALRNISLAHAKVYVTAEVFDSSGKIIDTDDPGAASITIPAGSFFFYGGERILDPGQRATHVRIRLDVVSSDSRVETLPKVENLHAQAGDRLRVAGEVVNTLRTPLSSFARIGIVLVGAGGQIVGGGYAYLGKDAEPGGRVPFDTGVGVGATDPSEVKRILGSVDLGP